MRHCADVHSSSSHCQRDHDPTSNSDARAGLASNNAVCSFSKTVKETLESQNAIGQRNQNNVISSRPSTASSSLAFRSSRKRGGEAATEEEDLGVGVGRGSGKRNTRERERRGARGPASRRGALQARAAWRSAHPPVCVCARIPPKNDSEPRTRRRRRYPSVRTTAISSLSVYLLRPRNKNLNVDDRP